MLALHGLHSEKKFVEKKNIKKGLQFGTILFPYQKCVTYMEEHISKNNSLSSSGFLVNSP
jgi:hypothetical protein